MCIAHWLVTYVVSACCRCHEISTPDAKICNSEIYSSRTTSCSSEASYRTQQTEQSHAPQAEAGALVDLLLWPRRPNHRTCFIKMLPTQGTERRPYPVSTPTKTKLNCCKHELEMTATFTSRAVACERPKEDSSVFCFGLVWFCCCCRRRRLLVCLFVFFLSFKAQS